MTKEMLSEIDQLIRRLGLTKSEATSDTSIPIQCALPLDDADYREIVLEFVDQLDRRLLRILSLIENEAYDELCDEAHWLKGCGGTVGYDPFTEPSIDLMQAARARKRHDCQVALANILDVRKRIVIPPRD